MPATGAGQDRAPPHVAASRLPTAFFACQQLSSLPARLIAARFATKEMGAQARPHL